MSVLIRSLERPERRRAGRPKKYSRWLARLNRVLPDAFQFVTHLPPRSEGRLKVGWLSREQCLNMYHLVARVVAMKVPGDVVELGCHQGGSALLIEKTLRSLGSDARIFLYDSFEGLPDSSAEDQKSDGGFNFQAGDLVASEEQLRRNFEEAGLQLPQIWKGWFSDIPPDALPMQICFAHLDGDLYSSIKDSLEIVYPRLAVNAIVVIDDYCDPELFPSLNILPGVKQACDEFFRDKPEQVESLLGGTECHGFFVKSCTGQEREAG